MVLMMSLRSPSSFQARLNPVGEGPASGLVFRGKAIALQPLHPVGQQMAVLPDEKALSFAGSEVDGAFVTLLFDQHPIEPGHRQRAGSPVELHRESWLDAEATHLPGQRAIGRHSHGLCLDGCENCLRRAP
jgi:hypothetical protein